MSATLLLNAPESTEVDQELLLSVTIGGARALSLVTVEVEHHKGAEPQVPTQSQVIRTDATGTGQATFTFRFQGKGRAVLLASAYDKSHTAFPQSADAVEVR
ncbi:hypothetical protein AB3662_44600 [Sorangium cellulosum]|uniref:hypothetical protein n=1 Tax=Sorangium cellulosum TaxID=56 RepID=UPI003D9A87FB